MRAPTMGAVTPGWSRTQARATSAGDRSRPSAARQTASTMRARARGEVLADVPLEGRRRARESAGTPVRYLPVSTPRPSGDQRRMPRPSASAAGDTSRSMPRSQQRVLHLGRRQPGAARRRQLVSRRLRRLPAGVVRDADVARPPGGHRGVERGQRLVEGYVVGPGVHLPQVDVVDAQPLQRVSRSRSRAPRDTSTTRSPCARPMPPLVASTTSSRATTLSSRVPISCLAGAVAVAGRGVEQGAAGVDEGAQLVGRVVLVGVGAPRPGAEAEAGDLQAGPTEIAVLHAAEVSRRHRSADSPGLAPDSPGSAPPRKTWRVGG